MNQQIDIIDDDRDEKSAAQKRRAEKRVRNVVKALRLLRLMAKNGRSPFTPQETDQMFAHLDRAFGAAKSEFTLQDEFRFEP